MHKHVEVKIVGPKPKYLGYWCRDAPAIQMKSGSCILVDEDIIAKHPFMVRCKDEVVPAVPAVAEDAVSPPAPADVSTEAPAVEVEAKTAVKGKKGKR